MLPHQRTGSYAHITNISQNSFLYACTFSQYVNTGQDDSSPARVGDGYNAMTRRVSRLVQQSMLSTSSKAWSPADKEVEDEDDSVGGTGDGEGVADHGDDRLTPLASPRPQFERPLSEGAANLPGGRRRTVGPHAQGQLDARYGAGALNQAVLHRQRSDGSGSARGTRKQSMF